jgi:hypothetical protein
MHLDASRNKDLAFADPRSLSDDQLLGRLSELLQSSRRVEAELVVHIGEVDDRRLFAREGWPSMFAYCTEALHLSEHEAYLRITVARAAREHPVLLTMLANGQLHLSGIAKLLPHLTRENRDLLLPQAAYKSKRQIEELVAQRAPQSDVPTLIRKLPARRTEPCAGVPADGLALGPDRVAAAAVAPPQRPAVMAPLAPARYKVQFTASAAFHDKLQRLKALMGTAVPDGDLAKILEDAVTEKLRRLEARRFGQAMAPRSSVSREDALAPQSRYPPAAVRRTVYERDGGQCRYVNARGNRCGAREQLEFHHVRAHARGGGCSPENIQLMCRAHNLRLAERDYGREHMARYRRKRGAGPPAQERGFIRASASTTS